MIITRRALLLAFVFVTSAALLAEPPKHVSLDLAKLGQVPAVMKDFVARDKISGSVTLIATHNHILHFEAIGLADIANNKPMTKETLFWIASMTKPITATAFMTLVDEGKVSVDDEVSKYIPSFKDIKLNGKPPARPVTLRDLLTHTSGIGEAGQSQSVAGSTLEAIADRIAAAPMKFEPGAKWNYGSGLTVIGRVIEVVTKESYENYLQKSILDPLKMNDTTFHLTAQQIPRVAKNYKPGKDGKGLEESPNAYVPKDPTQKQTPNPSGGLFSTASDLARFYQMVLNGGELDGQRILSAKAVKQMTTLAHNEKIETGFTPGNGWGLGWILTRVPQGASAALTSGSHGHGGAFGTQGWIDPNRGLIYVMLIQRSGFGNGDGSDVRTAFQNAVAAAIVP